MTYLSKRDRLQLRAFRDQVAASTVSASYSAELRSAGLVWQSTPLAISVANGLAKVCLCRMTEPEDGSDVQPDEMWLAAVVTRAPAPAPDFADEVPTIFELTCPNDFDYRLWVTCFKPLPADQQAWLFCAAGAQLNGLINQENKEEFDAGPVIEYIDRIHPPLVRSELLECRVGPGARVPRDEELVYANERYDVASTQMYYEMVESADAISTGEELADELADEVQPYSQNPSPTHGQKPQSHLFRWFDLWRRRSSLN